MKQRCHCLGIGPVFAALLLTGCGDPASVATVSGTVTHGGKSVAGVNVQFVPQDKKSPLASGPVDETGRYTLGRAMGRQGCAAGTYSVRLVEQDPGALPFRIPADMSTKSTLTFDVKPGANTFDIQIPVAAKPARK
jgi:hypothetical protein